MIPLRDSTPSRTLPVVAYALIAACCGIFVYMQTLSQEAQVSLYLQYGAIPRAVTAGPWPQAAMELLTYNFLHGSWVHLLGNMLYLWIFGDNVEDAMGHGRFLIFYLLSGVIAGLAHIALQAGSSQPLVGASGAIAGVLGAYLVLYPRASILSLLFFGWFIRLVELPAILVLGLWFLLQLSEGVLSLGARQAVTVAFWAHVGGFIAGALLIRLFVKRERVREIA